MCIIVYDYDGIMNKWKTVPEYVRKRQKGRTSETEVRPMK